MKKVFLVILVAIVWFVAIYGINTMVYNNGICWFCKDGEWIFQEVEYSSTNNDTHYCYTCSSCKKIHNFSIDPYWL